MNRELENEPNLEYNYEEEEEEGDEEEEKEKENDNRVFDSERKEINPKNKETKNKKEKEDENNIINEKAEIKKIEKEKNDIDNIENLGKDYIFNDNEISINTKKEENNNIENKKEPIIEEIDTTIPKNNPEEDNNNIEEEKNNDENKTIKGISANTVCHRLLPKGLDIDITKIVYFKCYKIKTKSNLISFIVGSKKVKVPYIIFLDENFYYMSKDKQVNPKNENIRRIGNRYDLSKISNFQTRKVNEDYEFAFEFMNEDYFDRIYKLLYFEPKDAELFFDIFQQFINNLGINIPSNITGMEEGEEQEEEGEEEEDDAEEEEEEIGENEEKEEGEKEENEQNDINNEKEKEEEKDIKVNDKEGNDKEKNINNKKDEIETNSTKEESKEIRDVEVIN